SVRPTNPAILDAFNQIRRLRASLPTAPIVVVAGDHDTPRSVETGTILRLFEAIEGVHILVHDAGRLDLEPLDLSLLCVPWAAFAGEGRPVLEPAAGPRHHVLVMHGELAGLPRDYDPAASGAPTPEPSELHADQWDY